MLITYDNTIRSHIRKQSHQEIAIMKNQFLNNEIWTLTIGGAFQRANVYKATVSDIDKRDFKSDTRKYIEENLLPQYSKSGISDEVHIKNIKELSSYTIEFSDLLQNDKLNFGVCQKMLNLYLKYQWCLGTIAPPPHFPVDRIIQEKLNNRAKKLGIKSCKVEAWTQFKDETKYLEIIQFAKNVRSAHKEFKAKGLPEMELILFERRNL
jgi:hypothetical protein